MTKVTNFHTYAAEQRARESEQMQASLKAGEATQQDAVEMLRKHGAALRRRLRMK